MKKNLMALVMCAGLMAAPVSAFAMNSSVPDEVTVTTTVSTESETTTISEERAELIENFLKVFDAYILAVGADTPLADAAQYIADHIEEFGNDEIEGIMNILNDNLPQVTTESEVTTVTAEETTVAPETTETTVTTATEPTTVTEVSTVPSSSNAEETHTTKPEVTTVTTTPNSSQPNMPSENEVTTSAADNKASNSSNASETSDPAETETEETEISVSAKDRLPDTGSAVAVGIPLAGVFLSVAGMIFAKNRK